MRGEPGNDEDGVLDSDAVDMCRSSSDVGDVVVVAAEDASSLFGAVVADDTSSSVFEEASVSYF